MKTLRFSLGILAAAAALSTVAGAQTITVLDSIGPTASATNPGGTQIGTSFAGGIGVGINPAGGGGDPALRPNGNRARIAGQAFDLNSINNGINNQGFRVNSVSLVVLAASQTGTRFGDLYGGFFRGPASVPATSVNIFTQLTQIGSTFEFDTSEIDNQNTGLPGAITGQGDNTTRRLTANLDDAGINDVIFNQTGKLFFVVGGTLNLLNPEDTDTDIASVARLRLISENAINNGGTGASTSTSFASLAGASNIVFGNRGGIEQDAGSRFNQTLGAGKLGLTIQAHCIPGPAAIVPFLMGGGFIAARLRYRK